MTIILKQTNYKFDGYDKSIVGSLTKKDKGDYVELMTKKDIARRVAEKNNVSVIEIQRKYKTLIDQKFDQIVDKYITAWISNKVYGALNPNPLFNITFEERPKSMLIRSSSMREGYANFVDDTNIVLFKDFEKVLKSARRRIKYKGVQYVSVGHPKKKDYTLVENKDMLKVYRLVDTKMKSIDKITIEHHTLGGKVTSYNVHIRSYNSNQHYKELFLLNPDYSVGEGVSLSKLSNEQKQELNKQFPGVLRKYELGVSSIVPVGSFGFKQNEETGKYHMYAA